MCDAGHVNGEMSLTTLNKTWCQILICDRSVPLVIATRYFSQPSNRKRSMMVVCSLVFGGWSPWGAFGRMNHVSINSFTAFVMDVVWIWLPSVRE